MLGPLVFEAGDSGTDWCAVMTELYGSRVFRIVTGLEVVWLDLGRVAGLTGGGVFCERWFRVLLFYCRGGSAACVLDSGGTKRRCPRADQARG